MNKLSLYDLFSFALPGFVLVIFMRFILMNFGYHITIEEAFHVHNEIATGLLLVTVSFIVGTFINGITYYLKDTDMYKHTGLYKSAGEIITSKSIPHIVLETLEKDCRAIFHKPIFHKDKGSMVFNDDYYSYIYYKLEVMNKINAPKAFQSFYFFFRNICTILIILMPATVALSIFNYATGISHSSFLYIVIFIIFSYIVCTVLARWHRAKMIERMIWSYFCYHTSKSNTYDSERSETTA